jgi:hypothetical protein
VVACAAQQIERDGSTLESRRRLEMLAGAGQVPAAEKWRQRK